jgi:hypothetical protein
MYGGFLRASRSAVPVRAAAPEPVT